MAAMVTIAATTTVSIVRMNQAARLCACGEGWVMPMVLMNAFEMKRRNFILPRVRWVNNSRGGDCLKESES